MSSTFPLGESNHHIPLNKAKEMTLRFRTSKQAVFNSSSLSADVLPICETFNSKAIKSLLEKPGCAGIRIYYGMDTDLKVHAILVPVNADGADILPSESSGFNSNLDDGPVEDSLRCPPYCPPPSPLNE